MRPMILTIAVAVALAVQPVHAQEPSSEEQPLVPLSPDHREVTELQTKALSNEMATLKAASELLEDLGKATEKKKGETTKQYLTRVNKIMKAEAFLIHLAHERVEIALDAKYQLEEAVAEYSRWVEQMSERVRQRPVEYKKQVDALVQKTQELRNDGQVLAYLIATQGSFDDKVRQRYRGEYDAKTIEQTPDFQARRQKFLDLSDGDWQEEFHRLVRGIQRNEAEQQFLAVRAIPESEDLANLLPAEHHKMVQQATELLRQHTDLETTADKVAIAAKYAIENLKLVSPFIDEMDETELFRRSQQAQEVAEELKGGLSGVIPSGISVPPPVGIMLGDGVALSPKVPEAVSGLPASE